MATSSKTNRAALEQRFNGCLTGISKHITQSVTLIGKVMTPQTLAAVFTDTIAASKDVDDAQTKLDAARKTQRAKTEKAIKFRAALERFLQGAWGSDNPQLKDFAFAVSKPKTKLVATKAKAVDKAKATRAARHTMGSRQKMGIKGDAASASAKTNGTNGKTV